MPRSLCLTRQCLGLTTRIECEICPLAGGQGLWMLLCAAGRSAAQPSEIRAQGPFHGPFVATTDVSTRRGEGNNPDRQLRSQIIAKWETMWDSGMHHGVFWTKKTKNNRRFCQCEMGIGIYFGTKNSF